MFFLRLMRDLLLKRLFQNDEHAKIYAKETATYKALSLAEQRRSRHHDKDMTSILD